ncbi:MAG TPA: hypothetical protein VFR95_10940 [Gemmatimonadaceae bacterium]|nr:hypothetical protein [Gemmatimonadaceae bacterium]
MSVVFKKTLSGFMRQLRRFTAIVANLLLLQFVLVGSGSACVDHGAGTGQASVTTSAQRSGPSTMPGMSMSGSSTTGHGASSCDTPSETTDGGAPCHSPSQRSDGHAPCHSPLAPTGCAGAVSCGSALAASTGSSPTFVTTTARIAVVSITAPRGPALLPELPPPRA